MSNNLLPKFIGPLDVRKCIRKVAYELTLPPELHNVHNVFHISILIRYEPNPSRVPN